MTQRSSRPPAPLPRKTWCWQRRLDPARVDEWIAKLESIGGLSWSLTNKPGRVTSVLEVYFQIRNEAADFAYGQGGRIRSVPVREWLGQRPAPPLLIGPALCVRHDRKTRLSAKIKIPSLHIPQGLAFGSGEHATTYMLLRALTRHPNLLGVRMLDLGTGSGVLALAARRLGASRIVATDFDAEAVRTAAANERLNFRSPRIHWKKADVRSLRAGAGFDLVLANLFSGILGEAAQPIAASVAAAGALWLSGILLTQRGEVVAAYEKQGMQLIRTVRRGKWIMLQWRKPTAQVDGDTLKNTVQTK